MKVEHGTSRARTAWTSSRGNSHACAAQASACECACSWSPRHLRRARLSSSVDTRLTPQNGVAARPVPTVDVECQFNTHPSYGALLSVCTRVMHAMWYWVARSDRARSDCRSHRERCRERRPEGASHTYSAGRRTIQRNRESYSTRVSME